MHKFQSGEEHAIPWPGPNIWWVAQNCAASALAERAMFSRYDGMYNLFDLDNREICLFNRSKNCT